MKKVYGPKLKIFLVIFLSSILFVNLSQSQTGACDINALYSGFLESPKFCFNKPVNITKFIWKGITEEGCISFTLEGFETSTSATPKAIRSFVVLPGVIYTSKDENYLLDQIQCLKYKIDFYKYTEDSIPRVDQIFIYYSF